MRHLGISDRHKTPIATPCIIQDRQNDRGFGIEIFLVHRANDNAFIPFARRDDALHQRGKGNVNRDLVGIEVFDTRITGRFNPRAISRVVIAHEYSGWVVMAVNQQPWLFPDRQAQRAQ